MGKFSTQSGSLSSEKRKLLALRLKQKGISTPEMQVIPKRETRDPCPLSFAQQRLWFLDQLEKGSTAYLVPQALSLRGDLSIECLRRSLEELVRRHGSLRTTFTTLSDQPVQVVHSAGGGQGQAVVPTIDLQGLRPEQRGEVAQWLADIQPQHPMSLTKGPLLRTYLLRLQMQEHVMLLTMHHIITDAWSNEVFMRELATLYRAYVSGQPSPLAPLPIQYVDYAILQREWLHGEVLEEQLAYWRKQLRGISPLALPTDHPRPPIQTYRGAAQSLRLSPVLSEELMRLCRKFDVTLFMLGLAAFQIALMRYTGQTDISVGTPIANRRRAELKGVIGFFVNTLVMRINLGGNPTFRQMLQRVRQVCLEGYAYQDIPFEKVVEELEPERDLSHSPLFQVMFVLQNVPVGMDQNIPVGAGQASVRALSEIRVSPLPVENPTSQFDLTLSLVETRQGLHCSLRYNTDLFEADTITRMLRNFQTLLKGIVQDPLARLSDLPLLTEVEREQLLVEWTRTREAGQATPLRQDLCVHQLFEQQVERTPDRIAMVDTKTCLTYEVLNQRANQLAHRLQQLGVGPEGIVGVCMQRSHELLIALLAIFKAGGTYLPLDPTHPVDWLTSLLEDVQPVVVLCDTSVVMTLQSKTGVPLLCIDIDRRDSALCLSDRDRRDNALCLSDGDAQEHMANLSRAEVTPENLAYIIYTSGSTGKPKGVMIHHRGMVNHLCAKIADLSLNEQDRIAQTASLSFDISLWQLLAALLVGGSTVIYSQEVVTEPAQLMERLRVDQVSIVEMVPSHLRALLHTVADRSPEQRSLRTLRWLIVTGEAFPPELCRQWQASYPEIPLLNAYGPTECSDDVTHFPIYSVLAQGRESPIPSLLSVPIGRPVNNLYLYVLDANLILVPIGATGELYVGGIGVGRGYLHDPSQTATTFVPNPYVRTGPYLGERLYKTGDLARYRADGAIEYLGRIDHQVKLRGYRIELGEIETLLELHEAIQECVVLIREDETGDKRLAPTASRLVAYLVVHRRQAQRLQISELRSYLQDRLPSYMIPQDFVFLDSLPLTPNGKIDRVAIGLTPIVPAPEKVQHAEEKGAEDARTPIEELLVGQWEEVLGRRQVNIHQNFFELGGHSLLATRLIARVRATLGVEVPLRALFEAPTVAEFAQRVVQVLREGEGVHIPPLVAMEREDVIPLSFAQQRLWFMDQLQPGRTEYLVPQVHHLSASLSPEVLERSLSEMIRRHESLRTTFTSTAGQPMQIIHPAGSYCLPIIDLRELAPEREKREAWQLARQEAHRPCDLEKGPLLRTYLLRLDHSNGYVLLLTLHHIITDGWSNNVLRRELVTLYRAYVSGQPSPLAPLPLQYADYAIWQREFLQGEILEAKLDYWTRRLAGAPPIELPADYPRPSVGARMEASPIPTAPRGRYFRERNEHVGTGVSLASHARSENEKPLSVGATHTSSDGASADRGFSFGCEPLEAERNPCPYEKPTPESIPTAPARGATHHFMLSQDLTQALQKLGREAGVTLFMVLLAAFNVLLYRSTGQVDLVVGTDSANRQQGETEGIIGFFVNLLALRTSLSGKPTFREVLLRVREVVLGAYTHQDMPFELLVEKLAPDHYLDRTPLIQALFVLQNIPSEPVIEENSASHVEREMVDQSFLHPREDEETSVKFDLAVFMWEREGSLFGAWNYRLDLFKASTIATLVARFEALLQSSVNEPDLPIDLLSLTPLASRAARSPEQQESKQRLPMSDDGLFDLPSIDFTQDSERR